MSTQPPSVKTNNMGAINLEQIERLFYGIMSGGSLIGRTLDKNRHDFKHRPHPAGIPGHTGVQCLDTSPQQHVYLEPRGSVKKRSVKPEAQRQMALHFGLKSLPLTTTWAPLGHLGYLVNLDVGPRNVSQSRLLFEPPDGSATSRTGLSGSKLRKRSSTPHSGSQTPGSSCTIDHSKQGQLKGGNPSPRASLQRLTSGFSQSALVDDEDESGLVSNYKWNASDQGQRLQRELTTLSSRRDMRRASEMLSHRIDPLYLMNGSKMSLQSRYSIDDVDVKKKLHNLTQIREGLVADLKKMKIPYGTRACKQNAKNMKSVTSTNPSSQGPKSQYTVSPHSNPTSPSIPATDSASDKYQEPLEQTLSDDTDTGKSVTGPEGTHTL